MLGHQRPSACAAQPSAAALADASRPHPQTPRNLPKLRYPIPPWRQTHHLNQPQPYQLPQYRRTNRAPLRLVHPPKMQMLTQRPPLQPLNPPPAASPPSTPVPSAAHSAETTPAAGSLVKPPIARSRAISARNSLMSQHFQNSKKNQGPM